MNERLEIEIRRFYEERYSALSDGAKITELGFVDIARHFYNFALQDVKTEVNYWLAEIHRVCDITDENGYRVKLRDLQASLEENIDNPTK